MLDSILPCINRLLPSVNRSLNTDQGRCFSCLRISLFKGALFTSLSDHLIKIKPQFFLVKESSAGLKISYYSAGDFSPALAKSSLRGHQKLSNKKKPRLAETITLQFQVQCVSTNPCLYYKCCCYSKYLQAT